VRNRREIAFERGDAPLDPHGKRPLQGVCHLLERETLDGETLDLSRGTQTPAVGKPWPAMTS
jgi:hypothetical protein